MLTWSEAPAQGLTQHEAGKHSQGQPPGGSSGQAGLPGPGCEAGARPDRAAGAVPTGPSPPAARAGHSDVSEAASKPALD